MAKKSKLKKAEKAEAQKAAKALKAATAEKAVDQPLDPAAAKKPKVKKAGKARGGEAPPKGQHLLTAAEIGARQETFNHPWNPKSEVIGVRLGHALGLTRVAVNIARIPAGQESFLPHAHQREEEWLFILSGQGMALIGEEEIAVSMGDFLAFPAPQTVHHLKNPGPDDLVYLMGGEQMTTDAVDFPTLGKRLVAVNGEPRLYGADDGRNPFAGGPPQGKKAV